MSLPAWPGEHRLGEQYLKGNDLLTIIGEWEAWPTEDNHAKDTIKKRRLDLLYDELEFRTD
jgi:hypothetical protein